jgi:hypothetical protein
MILTTNSFHRNLTPAHAGGFLCRRAKLRSRHPAGAARPPDTSVGVESTNADQRTAGT